MTNAHSMKPVRVQRRRVKGYRMPPNTVYVGRPTKWGNPFKGGEDGTRKECVANYRHFMGYQILIHEEIRRELRGKNLACFCKLTEPCHVDVLLEMANPEATP